MSKTKPIRYIAHCKKWRDTINGNTYHSVRIISTKTKKEIKIPFTYGYGDQYKSSALNAICKKDNSSKFNLYHDFIYWIDENNCLMRDVKKWGLMNK
jgi:hypothetical protein